MTDKDVWELERATHFMRWVAREDLSPLEKPDRARRSRPGGHPDFVFCDSAGQHYNLEIGRWLPRELLEVEDFLDQRLACHFHGVLEGTYVLRIPVELPIVRLGPAMIDRLRSSIDGLLAGEHGVPDTVELGSGTTLAKVREDGSRLVPWIAARELPLTLDARNRAGRSLKEKLSSVISEAHTKFEGYSGQRIVLLDITQSGLDIDYHAGYSSDGLGIVLRWCSQLIERRFNIDRVFLEPGVRLWSGAGGGMTRILTGHRHIDGHEGYYREIWTQPNLQRP